ncbi:MAG: hypothetical protein ACOC6J_07655 [Spirochaetota bacterium]
MSRFYPFAVIVTLAVFVVMTLTTGGAFIHFASVQSLILVVVPTLALSLANFSLGELGRCFSVGFTRGPADRTELLGARAYFDALGKYLIVSGFIGFFTGAIILLANLGGDPSVIGSGTAVALLTVLYAMIFYILVPVPFGVGVRKKLAELEEPPGV